MKMRNFTTHELDVMDRNRSAALLHLHETGVIDLNKTPPNGIDAAIIRAGVVEHANAKGLTKEQSAPCENAALDKYWILGRSNAYCISVGVAEVEATVKRIAAGRVPDDRFCCQRQKCLGLTRCPRDPVCNN